MANKRPAVLRGKARLRCEIVEMTRTLHKVGAVSGEELERTILQMLGREALARKRRGAAPSVAKKRIALRKS